MNCKNGQLSLFASLHLDILDSLDKIFVRLFRCRYLLFIQSNHFLRFRWRFNCAHQLARLVHIGLDGDVDEGEEGQCLRGGLFTPATWQGLAHFVATEWLVYNDWDFNSY